MTLMKDSTDAVEEGEAAAEGDGTAP